MHELINQLLTIQQNASQTQLQIQQKCECQINVVVKHHHISKFPSFSLDLINNYDITNNSVSLDIWSIYFYPEENDDDE